MAIPPEALAAHEEGRRHGAQGKFVEALVAFARATQLAPEWPYPIYDTAYTHLLMGNLPAALAAYEHVDRLAPRGFFTSKTALWALHQEQLGRFPRGTYIDFLAIEQAATPTEKSDRAAALARKHPDYAPVYVELAKTAHEPDEALALLDMGLGAAPDIETRGLLSLNRSAVLRVLGRNSEADDELTTLLATPGITMAAEKFAKQLLGET